MATSRVNNVPRPKRVIISKKVMSDTGIFGQADYVVRILHDDMKTIPEIPAFREWVNMDILSFEE